MEQRSKIDVPGNSIFENLITGSGKVKTEVIVKLSFSVNISDK